MTRILGIESSCDETAAAVVEGGRRVRSSVVASQHALHERYGGVVPEIASRAHLERIGPVVRDGLAQAEMEPGEVDAVAVGHRPGLIGSLLVGVSAAQALAWSLGKPLIGVDHVRAHLHAARLVPPEEDAASSPDPAYPAVGLVVSGGHTRLYAMPSPGELRLLGGTLDDAVGEAFDKAAAILDLGYPGGPAVEKAAREGDAGAYELPRSLMEKDNLDFSFSGLKTALLYTVRGRPRGRGRATVFERSITAFSHQQRADLAASFQRAVVEVLVVKIERALDHLEAGAKPCRSLILGGGVAANAALRQGAADLGRRWGLAVCLPGMRYCVDNAAMIAGLAYPRYQAGDFDDLNLPARATGG